MYQFYRRYLTNVKCMPNRNDDLALVDFKHSLKNIPLLLIYCHPGASITEFKKQFTECLLKNNIEESKDTYIFEDINTKSLKIDEKTSVKNYFNEINSFGLTNSIDVPTSVTNV